MLPTQRLCGEIRKTLRGAMHVASVATLDVRPTGNQEVVGSTPAGSATFFRGDMLIKYFLP